MDMIYGNDEESRFASFQQINLQALSGLAAPHVFFKKIGATKEYIDTLSYLQMLCSMGNEGGVDFSFCRWQDKTMYIPMNRMAISSKSQKPEGAADKVSPFGKRTAADCGKHGMYSGEQ